jgi:hypothetical protein
VRTSERIVICGYGMYPVDRRGCNLLLKGDLAGEVEVCCGGESARIVQQLRDHGRRNLVVTFAHLDGYQRPGIMPIYTKQLRALHHRIVDVHRKPPTKAKEFMDAQGAIDATLEAWLPSLVKSNDSLVAALTRLRDFYLAGTPLPGAAAVLVDVEAALDQAAKTRRGF